MYFTIGDYGTVFYAAIMMMLNQLQGKERRKGLESNNSIEKFEKPRNLNLIISNFSNDSPNLEQKDSINNDSIKIKTKNNKDDSIG